MGWGLVIATTLTVALGVAVLWEPQIQRADFPTYFAFLRSLAFDRDLDFANEWAHWGFKEQPITPTGHRFTQGSIGPAIFWSPFFALSHLVVLSERALGTGRYPVDGYSGPYMRSVVLGTVTFVVLGAFALAAMVGRLYSRRVTLLAILGTIGATPILLYTFGQPGMAHGLTFALTSFAIFIAFRLERDGTKREWFALGLVLGLLIAIRLQAVVVVVFLLPLLVRDLGRRRLKPADLAAAALGAFLGFLPQLLAWKAIYGHYITFGGELEAWAREAGVKLPVLFRLSSWFDPRSLHFGDVLFSAERGLFTWTPVALLGLVGLVLALRRAPLLALGGLLTFVTTAWFNGSLAGFEGADAFGARRFDLFFPFLALGLAAVLELTARRPLLAPSFALALLVLWNVGFIRLWQHNLFPRAAPLERLAAAQAKQAEALSGQWLGRLFGARGRAFAYNTFEGEYLYWNLPEDGYFAMGDPGLRYLGAGWSPAINRTGPPQFRTAFHPRACLHFPLMVGVPLHVTVTAKAPERVGEQTLALDLNAHKLAAQPLPSDWADLSFEFERGAALPGENTLCLEFSAGATKGDLSQRIAAHVRLVVVHSKTSSWPNPLWGLYGLGR